MPHNGARDQFWVRPQSAKLRVHGCGNSASLSKIAMEVGNAPLAVATTGLRRIAWEGAGVGVVRTAGRPAAVSG